MDWSRSSQDGGRKLRKYLYAALSQMTNSEQFSLSDNWLIQVTPTESLLDVFEWTSGVLHIGNFLLDQVLLSSSWFHNARTASYDNTMALS